MKALVHSDASFLVALKSAAGFAMAATAVVGMVVWAAGFDPANVQWLLYLSAAGGAAAGAAFGSSSSAK